MFYIDTDAYRHLEIEMGAKRHGRRRSAQPRFVSLAAKAAKVGRPVGPESASVAYLHGVPEPSPTSAAQSAVDQGGVGKGSLEVTETRDQ